MITVLNLDQISFLFLAGAMFLLGSQYYLCTKGDNEMPGPSRFSPKDDREIAHIKSSALARGVPSRMAENMAYGHVVNQQKGRRTGVQKASNFKPKK